MVEKETLERLGFEEVDVQKSEETMGDRLDDLYKQEPCEECISRAEAISRIELRRKVTCESDTFNYYEEWTKGYEVGIDDAIAMINSVPPVTPQHTEAEIQKMQEMEQAEIGKAYDLGKSVDILDKIREEIKDLDVFYDNDYFSDNRDAMFKCNDVLQIIDKYKAESEN